MSEIYYDRKGVGHLSAWGRDAANLRYASADQQGLEELKQQTLLAHDQLDLAKQNHHYSQQAAASQQRQADVLEQQAKEMRNHLQFEKDIAWLERCDPLGRFNYLLGRCRTQLVAMLVEEVFKAAKIARFPVQDSLIALLRLATAAKQQWEDIPRFVEKTKAELEAARLATFKGIAGWGLLGYLAMVPVLAAFIAMLLEHGKGPSATDLGFCMILSLSFTCPVGYIAIRGIRAYSDARRTPVPIHIGQSFQLKADTCSD